MPLRHWLQLSLAAGVGPVLSRRLVDAAGGAEAACAATPALLRGIDGLGRLKSDAIARALRAAAAEAEAELQRAARLGGTILCPEDVNYPVLLRSIPDPPAVLYMKGSLEPRDLNAVAIVGSRKCSLYGREQAERFGALLAGAGVTVTSGGARGIDSAAHHGAMSHPYGRTIAVLGCGLDVTYPPENGPLFERIAAKGAVLSEYALGTPPLADNFPRRNRIVSGMSRGVLVIEADERSGALITARQACDDHGRTVFALPGRVDNPLSIGPHQLLRDGATLATRIEDILDNLGPLPQEALEPLAALSAPNAEANAAATEAAATEAAATEAAATEAAATEAAAAEAAEKHSANARDVSGLTDRQRAILSALDREPTAVDQLIDRTGLGAPEVLQELTFLSLRGRVRRIDGQTYARR